MRAIFTSRLFTHYWLPVLGWMLVIFLFSCQAHSGAITATYFGSWNVPVRKTAHVLEYLVLAVLARRAFVRSGVPAGGIYISKRMIFTAALCGFNASLDEWHQSFVPGRSASVSDAMIDMFGALIGLVFLEAKEIIACQKR
jgi:VanZ family protein